MTVILGPYPLCEACIAVNGGLVGAAHPQVHVAAHDRASCVDIGLAGLLPALWAVCETRSCCEDDGGRAYVTPAADDRDAAADLLAALGLDVEDDGGVLRFPVPPDARLGDAAWVRERLAG